MKGWRVWLAGLLLLVTVVAGRGQVVPGWQGREHLPEPPVFGVLDESGFFARNPEGLKRIANVVRGLEEKRGFKIHVVVDSVLVAEAPAEYATRLQRAWLPEGDGVVVVYQTDGRVLGFGRGVETEVDLQSGKMGMVPSYKTLELLTGVLESVDPKLPPEVYLETLVTRMAEAYENYFTQREVPLPDRALSLGVITVGVLSLVGLGVLGVGRLMRRSGSEIQPGFRFPEQEVRERLGAPYGGGEISSRRFGGDAGRGV